MQKDKDRNALNAPWRQIKRFPAVHAVHAAGVDRGPYGKAAEMHLLLIGRRKDRRYSGTAPRASPRPLMRCIY